jgi:hypothetical protein
MENKAVKYFGSLNPYKKIIRMHGNYKRDV